MFIFIIVCVLLLVTVSREVGQRIRVLKLTSVGCGKKVLVYIQCETVRSIDLFSKQRRRGLLRVKGQNSYTQQSTTPRGVLEKSGTTETHRRCKRRRSFLRDIPVRWTMTTKTLLESSCLRD